MIFLLLKFLDSNKPVLLIGFGLFVLSVVSYQQGVKSVREEWQEANDKARLEAILINQHNNSINDKTKALYDTGIKTIDDNYNAAIASLQPNTSGNLSSKTNTTSRAANCTSRNAVYKENKRLRLELARDAEINTQRLISLQEWTKEVK
jgi:hypothetical protein